MTECCGCERKQWAFILGCCILAMVILSLVIFVICFVVLLVVVDKGQSNQKAVEDAHQKAFEDFPPPQGRESDPTSQDVASKTDSTFDTIRILAYVLFALCMVFCLVEIGFSVVLILGAKRCSRKLLNIWVWAGIVFCVLHIIFGVAGSVGGAHVYLGTGLILIALYICALIVVWPLRAECEDGGAGPAGRK